MLAIEVTRRLIAVLIVVGLGFGVWALWPRGESDTPTATTSVAANSSTTSTAVGSTTTAELATSTSGAASEVVGTVEEAEEILRELLVNRYVAIRNEDLVLLRETVASGSALANGVNAFGRIPFTAPPSPDDLILSNVLILRSDSNCLVVAAEVDPSAFVEIDEPTSSVFVVRKAESSWKWMSVWRHPEDLWEADCEALLESF